MNTTKLNHDRIMSLSYDSSMPVKSRSLTLIYDTKKLMTNGKPKPVSPNISVYVIKQKLENKFT